MCKRKVKLDEITVSSQNVTTLEGTPHIRMTIMVEMVAKHLHDLAIHDAMNIHVAVRHCFTSLWQHGCCEHFESISNGNQSPAYEHPSLP